MNKKTSKSKMATLASKVLRDDRASKIQKTLAGSVLSQAAKGKETSAEMETIASKALQSKKSSDITQSLAGSVLSQSNKSR